MNGRRGGSRIGILGFLGLIAVGLAALRRLRRPDGKPRFAGVYAEIAQALDRLVGWHRMPLPLALLTFVGIRKKLRLHNLYDTGTPHTHYPAPPPLDDRYLTARSADGTYNDLDHPLMGSAGTRFGRNVPLDHTFPDNQWSILRPNPRTVSRELLTRDQFIPATSLNLLAAAWLQFMVRDWFSHGKSPKEDPWELPLQEDDPWPERPMRILRTRQDPTRSTEEDTLPPTYVNVETHWWDGSQIYGSNAQTQSMVRSERDGKLDIGPDGLIPVDPRQEKQPADEPGFWAGLAMLRILFTLEHNAICDRLSAEYPSWSDDDLFHTARLVNTALLAKIHTVEWTTAILSNPTTVVALRGNWWGIAGERLHNRFGRISESEVISGIPGSETDHFDVPYAITEEFVAVYRMHPLIPDDFTFRSVSDDRVLQDRDFHSVQGRATLELINQVEMPDLLYSFGVDHPGAVTLHNYPRGLQFFHRPDGILQDLAATDILRSRELGAPRYNEFRRLLHLRPAHTFEELTANSEWAEQMRQVYDDDLESVDLMVGLYAENPPAGFGFSDTAFRIFILMASRRLNSDRFFTTHYTADVYTQVGLDWIDDNSMSTVLLRHYPALGPALKGVRNAFAPWTRVST